MTHPLVENICVYGDPLQNFLVALVVPSKKAFHALADKSGKADLEWEEMCEDAELTQALLSGLQMHGKTKGKLEKFEIPLKAHLCPEAWTPSMDLLTEALKLKRKPIEKKYRKVLDDLCFSSQATSVH
jgi:long-chain acyl-CoA synthetase